MHLIVGIRGIQILMWEIFFRFYLLCFGRVWNQLPERSNKTFWTSNKKLKIGENKSHCSKKKKKKKVNAGYPEHHYSLTLRIKMIIVIILYYPHVCFTGWVNRWYSKCFVWSFWFHRNAAPSHIWQCCCHGHKCLDFPAFSCLCVCVWMHLVQICSSLLPACTPGTNLSITAHSTKTWIFCPRTTRLFSLPVAY